MQWPSVARPDQQQSCTNALYIHVNGDDTGTFDGHLHPKTFDSKAQAGQLALGAIDRGQQAINHGHSMLQFATNDQSQSEAIVERAVQNAMQTVGLGHNQIAQRLKRCRLPDDSARIL